MMKTYGVCFGMLAMGLAMIGAPVSRAQSRMAAGGSGGGSETTTASAPATPAASSPADLDRRIEALETELSELRTELSAKKEADAAAAAAAPAPVPAVTAAAQDAAKPPEKTTIASLLGPTSLSGFVDTYYQLNFHHPNQGPDNGYPGAGFRAFDFNDRAISLNMIELILDKAPDPMGGAAGKTGYHVSVGYGDAMNVVNSTDPGNITTCSLGNGYVCGGLAPSLKEAYFSYLAPVGKGLQIDVGKFVTPMGAEVIESKDNWNYSRGLLFTYAIPFFHFGARAKYSFNDKYSLTGFLVNGWNNIGENNTGKTYGFAFAGTPTKQWSVNINYLAGSETPAGSYGFTTTGKPINVNSAWRQVWDGTVMYTPTAQWSFMVNGDYGRGDRTTIFNDSSQPALSPVVYWVGGAGYVKYTPDANDYLAVRYEYYDDHDGFTTTSSVPSSIRESLPSGVFNASGNLIKPHYNEITATYQRTIASYLLARAEYRRDMSQFPVYADSTFAAGVKNQNTASISLIFLFDSRNAK